MSGASRDSSVGYDRARSSNKILLSYIFYDVWIVIFESGTFIDIIEILPFESS